jgi:hypothetical protein
LIPVPLRFAVVGDPKALWTTVRAPETAPWEDGEKTRLIEHVRPAARVLGDVGQLFVWRKFALGVIELIVRGTFWTFLRVMVFAELLLPRVTLPKLMLPGDKFTGWAPVPLRLIVCGLPLALSAMLIELLKVPGLVGLKVTPIVQCAVGASDAGDRGQLSVSEKGALGCETLAITSGAFPVLVRRTDLTELVVPIA